MVCNEEKEKCCSCRYVTICNGMQRYVTREMGLLQLQAPPPTRDSVHSTSPVVPLTANYCGTAMVELAVAAALTRVTSMLSSRFSPLLTIHHRLLHILAAHNPVPPRLQALLHDMRAEAEAVQLQIKVQLPKSKGSGEGGEEQ